MKDEKITVYVSRKLSFKVNEDWNSTEVGMGFEGTLEKGEGRDEMYEGTEAWLTAHVAAAIKRKKNEYSLVDPPETSEKPHFEAQEMTEAEFQEEFGPAEYDEEYVPMEEVEQETETIDVQALRVWNLPSGGKGVKVIGGKWKKFGVTVYPEVYEKLQFNVENREPADYPPQPGLKAIVSLKADGKPDKVTRFFRG